MYSVMIIAYIIEEDFALELSNCNKEPRNESANLERAEFQRSRVMAKMGKSWTTFVFITVITCFVFPNTSRAELFVKKTVRSIPRVLDHEIQRLADTCLSEKICRKIDKVKLSKVPKVSSDSQIQELTTVMPSDICDGLCPSSTTSSIIQSTINKIVDIALAELIAKLREKNEGTIHVPNIDEYFSKGSGVFKLKGHFEAVNGTFRDLTTLKRTEDAILSHNGLKFSASCGFGLSVAHLHYPHYSLHLGIFKVNGEMTGNVAGMALEAKVSINYDKVPCVATLDELEVTEFGRMKIKVTGLGPLNSLISKLLSWLTKKWREEIVVKVENKLRRIVTKQLSQFDCERFRP